MDAFTRAMFGVNAIHVPFNGIVQEMGGVYVVLAQVNSQAVTFGGKATHQLIMGDAIIRPHLVVESNKFRGHGAAGLLTMSPAAWVEAEDLKVLIDVGGRALPTHQWADPATPEAAEIASREEKVS